MARKKKKASRHLIITEEAADDLLALGHIYPEDFVSDEDGQGFQLRVVPHPGNAEGNHVSVLLAIRYPADYPNEPLQLKVQDPKGLSVAQQRALSKALHLTAEQRAQQNTGCVYVLVDQCQEYLREQNAAESNSVKLASLWHEMQQRDTRDGTLQDGQGPVDSSLLGNEASTAGWAGVGFDGGLFDDDPQMPWLSPLPPVKGGASADQAGTINKPGIPRKTSGRDAGPTTTASQMAGPLVRYASGSESSQSRVGGMLGAMLSGISRALGALPRPLRRLLDGSGEVPEGESDDGAEDSLDRATIRRQLMMGHLLALATEGGGTAADAARLPPQALPALAAALEQRDLVAGWVPWLLARPATFQDAFQRAFAEDVEASKPGGAEASSLDPTASWVLQRFWQQRRPSDPPTIPPAAPAPPAVRSRYVSDFEEVREVGRGGFGVVVAAVNRLDQRQYAIKKIKMDSSSLSARNRLIREVATLSKLHHPHVVRYFQAWCEVVSGEEAGSGSDDESIPTTEGELLGPFSQGPRASQQNSVSAAQRSLPAAPDLQTVPEGSGEEQATTGNGTSSGDGWWQSHSKATASSFTATGEAALQAGAGITSRGRAGQRAQEVLYIQMEFCPRTLKDVLDQGALLQDEAGTIDEASAWQVVRQLLAGLAHIHQQGIIHRDLKPANIFYDARADIKLGDFGLAKFNSASQESDDYDEAAGRPSRAKEADTGSLLSDVTGKVGTSVYISPEIEKGWATYDGRVDLFSLGVVMFELWHPFATGMERVALLRDLRDRSVMPPAWEARNPQVAKLIRWLMAANPADRPSAQEVLRSELLPPTVGDEQLTDLLRSLPDNQETYSRVVDAIFSMSPADSADVLGAPVSAQLEARDQVVETVKGVFARHGAVPMASHDVGFASAAGSRAGAVKLLAPSGAQLALRHELRRPFAEWLARTAPQRGEGLRTMRRYEVAPVWRHAIGRGLPKTTLQADFDVVSPVARGTGDVTEQLAEAEVIKAVAEVLDALPEAGRFEVRLGHRALLEACLAHIGLPAEVQGAAVQLLGTAAGTSPLAAHARSKHWPSIRVGLEGLGLDAAAVARCKAFVLQIPGEADAALHRLRAKLDVANSPRGAATEACLNDIQAVLGHLQSWGLAPRAVVVDPLLPPLQDYFSSLLFRVYLVHPDTEATSVIAAGGRYNALLKAVWPAAVAGAGPVQGAVGVTLNVERLMAAALPQRPRDASAQVSQADVLVCSKGGGGLLRERMALLQQLWAAGLRVEMVQLANPSLTQQYEYANARSISWIAIIHGATFSAADTVKVRNLDKRTAEEEVPFSEVARYLQGQIQGQATHNHSSRTAFGRAPSAAVEDADVSGPDSSADVEDASDLREQNYHRGRRRRDRK